MENKQGRPEYRPSIKDREQVEIMAAMGLTQKQMAMVLKISEPTLRKYFEAELECGRHAVNSRVVAKLYEKCMIGDTTALIFWCKTRLKWSDKDQATETQRPLPAFTIHTLARQEPVLEA